MGEDYEVCVCVDVFEAILEVCMTNDFECMGRFFYHNGIIFNVCNLSLIFQMIMFKLKHRKRENVLMSEIN